MKPKVAFICPFNLDRLSGTPIRARVTIEGLQGLCDIHILSLGGNLPNLHLLEDVWQRRDGRQPFFRLDRFTKATLTKLKVIKPDIIHAINTASVLPAVIYKLRYRKTKFVFEMHGLSAYEMRYASFISRSIFQILDRIGMVLADAIVSVSYAQKNLLCKLFKVRFDKMHVLWDPINQDIFQYQDPPSIPLFNVGYLGNDNFWQGLDTIFAVAKLLEGEENIHFFLGGFDPVRYKQLNLKNVTFCGIVPYNVAPVFLAKCHVLLSTRVGGRLSGVQYPNKLSHYLIAGRPVIASGVSDQALILKEANCGIIFPDQNAKALAEAIVKLRELPEKDRLQMGLNARHFAESRLSVNELAKRLIEIYVTPY